MFIDLGVQAILVRMVWVWVLGPSLVCDLGVVNIAVKGLGTVILSVCPSVCLSLLPRFLPLRATRRQKSDNTGR